VILNGAIAGEILRALEAQLAIMFAPNMPPPPWHSQASGCLNGRDSDHEEVTNPNPSSNRPGKAIRHVEETAAGRR
jgi:hypothetical protein